MTTPPRRPAPPRLAPSTYVGLGILGLALLVLGVWYTALQGVPYAGYLRIALAVAGGYLAVLGFARWYQLRDEPRRRGPPPANRPVPGLPSLEIYSPGAEENDRSPHRELAPVPVLARRNGRGRAVALALGLTTIVLILLLSSLSATAFVGSGTSASPAVPASRSDAALSGGAATALRGPVVPAASPVTGSGAIMCNPPLYPVYTTVNSLYPPLPTYADQKPCKVTADAAHGTFSSNAPGSGERLTVPIDLPNATAQVNVYGDFFVGMVVAGNASSVDGQSYAEIVFQPSGTQAHPSWTIYAAVWSLLINSSCATGSVAGLNTTWLGSYGCVWDEVNDGLGALLISGVPGDQASNLTFVGSATVRGEPLRVWWNDTTNANYSTVYNFTKANTGSDTFQPYYVSSCDDLCLLNWSMPYGLGVGVDLCNNPPPDVPSCFSYNATTQAEEPPFTVGSPEYWVSHAIGGTYTGDYLYFSPESDTGACSGAGAVPPCAVDAEAGNYPFFSFNGTQLNFGTNWTWTTQDWGGAYYEFNAVATLTDDTPMFLTGFANSSRAGFLAPGVVLNVSIEIQDLGSVRLVNLSYTLPGGSLVNSTMSRSEGNASEGIYYGTVPATGADGTITFRVWATNNASALLAVPEQGTPPASVLRGPIPTFQVTVDTFPASCGGLSLNGSAYQPNGTLVSIEAGTYAARADGCSSYGFETWVSTGGVSVAGTGPSAEVTAHGNGTVTAVWQYVRPTDVVTLSWSPTTCGSTFLNGSSYSAPGPTPVDLLFNDSYSLSATACGGDSFAGWTFTGGPFDILGDSLTPLGSGNLTANFLPTSSSATVTFLTDPSTCGGDLLRGVGYVGGETIYLAVGAYPVGPDPCAGYGWAGVTTTTGGLSVSGGTLTVSGSGSVEFQYYKLTLVTVVTFPSGCGGILWDGVAEPGGTVLNVTNHTDHSIAADPCAGSYLVGFLVTGNLTLLGSVVEANGPGNVEAIYRAGVPTFFVGFITNPSGCGSIVFNGTAYPDAQYVDVTPDSVARVGTTACPGYGFVSWVLSGGIQIEGGYAYVNQSGAIEAIFHPLVSVLVQTSPTGCGGVNLSGVVYPDGKTLLLPDNAIYSVAAVPCLHDVLSAWETSNGATIANGSVTIVASAIITAIFVPAYYAVGLFVLSDGCGGVVVNGVEYANNTTLELLAGPYTIGADLCAGYALSTWATSGGLSVNASGLYVNASGNLTEVAGAVPPTVVVSAPTSAASGTSVRFTATVGVPVPPYDYTYLWNFGDGTTANTTADFTTHTYGSTGTFTVQVTVIDPLHRSASSSVAVTVVPPSSGPSFGISNAALLVLVGVVVLLAVAVVVALWLRRRNAPEDRDTGAPPGTPMEGTAEADGQVAYGGGPP